MTPGLGSLSLADDAPGLYHDGNYMPAVTLAGVVDLPGFGLATSGQTLTQRLAPRCIGRTKPRGIDPVWGARTTR